MGLHGFRNSICVESFDSYFSCQEEIDHFLIVRHIRCDEVHDVIEAATSLMTLNDFWNLFDCIFKLMEIGGSVRPQRDCDDATKCGE